MYVNTMNVDEIVVDKMTRWYECKWDTVNERTVYDIHDEMSIKMPVYKITVKGMSVDDISADEMTVNKMPVDKITINVVKEPKVA